MQDDISPSPLALSIKISKHNKRRTNRMLSFNAPIFKYGKSNDDMNFEMNKFDDNDNFGKGEDDYKIKIKSKIKTKKDDPIFTKIKESLLERDYINLAQRKTSKDCLNELVKFRSEYELEEDQELKKIDYGVDDNDYGNGDDLFLEMELEDEIGFNRQNHKEEEQEDPKEEEDPEDQDLAILDVLKKANKQKNKGK